jgi:hypothetical protein
MVGRSERTSSSAASDDKLAGCQAQNAAGGASHQTREIARRGTEAGWRAAVLDKRGSDMLLACERAANQRWSQRAAQANMRTFLIAAVET